MTLKVRVVVAVVVQLLSHVWLFATPWTATCQAPLSFTISWSLFKFMSIELVRMHHLTCLLLLLPSIFPSIRVFSDESVLCIRWPKDWSFSFSNNPSSEYFIFPKSHPRPNWGLEIQVQSELRPSLLAWSLNGVSQQMPHCHLPPSSIRHWFQ